MYESFFVWESGEQVLVQMVHLNYYQFEEVFIKADQIVDPEYPLQDIHDKHNN